MTSGLASCAPVLATGYLVNGGLTLSAGCATESANGAPASWCFSTSGGGATAGVLPHAWRGGDPFDA
ncbi:hypothetical protein ACMHYB_53650 [Sorangium sp. So ce1128]